MNSLLIAIAMSASSSAPPSGGSAPPPAPNVCSSTLCLEVFPLPDPATGKLRKPFVRITEEKDGSSIELEFTGIGTVTVADAADAIAGEEVALSFAPGCRAGERCRRIKVKSAPAPDGVKADRLSCQIRTIWVMQPGAYRISDGAVSLAYSQKMRLRPNGGTCQIDRGR